MSAIEQVNIVEQIGKLKLQGKSDSEIAKTVGIKRTQVVPYYKEFQSMLLDDDRGAGVVDKLGDILFESSQSMRMVLDELWMNYREAKSQGEDKLAVDVLKEIRTLTGQRHKMLVESGYGDDELAAEMEETARRQEIIIGLFRTMKTKYPETAKDIAQELSKISEVEVITTERDEDV